MEFGILGPLSLVDSDGRSYAQGAMKLTNNLLSEQSGLAVPSHRLRFQQVILSRSIDVLSIRPQSPMRSIA
ncbi:hypothetical protein [Streptomyces sp. NPDC052036]|uniref:hypothetical protein n=1 Tax=unclassified Streptomyces TaxID=2593676 RepID=UPI003413A11A